MLLAIRGSLLKAMVVVTLLAIEVGDKYADGNSMGDYTFGNGVGFLALVAMVGDYRALLLATAGDCSLGNGR